MPIYDFICLDCGEEIKNRLMLTMGDFYCPKCQSPMQKGAGSIAFYRIKGDIQGSTPGIRKKAAELTKRSVCEK